MFRIKTKNNGPIFYKKPRRGEEAFRRFWSNRRLRNASLGLVAIVAGYFTWTHGQLLPQRDNDALLVAQANSPLPPEWLNRYFGKKVCTRENYCGPDADPDKDGLINYEEFLFFTDPTNPDTDGDGAKDGEEVRNLTNPLGYGSSSTPRDISNVYEYNPFADQIAQEGVEQIKNGDLATLDQIKEAASRVTRLPEFNHIPFQVKTNNNQSGVDQYLASLVGATNKYRSNAAVAEGPQIIDTTDLSLLEQYIEATSLYATTLVFIDVPSDLLQFHKALYGSLIYQAVSANNQKEFISGALTEDQARDQLRNYTILYTRYVQLMHNFSQEISQKYVFPFNFDSPQ